MMKKAIPTNLQDALDALFREDSRDPGEIAKHPFIMRLLYKNLIPNAFGRVVLIGTVKSWGPTPTSKAKIIGGICSLVYVLEGSGHFSRSDGLKRNLKAGDMFFTFPEFRHSYGGGLKAWSDLSVWYEGPIFDALFSTGVLDKNEPFLHLEPILYWQGKLQDLIVQDAVPSRENALLTGAKLLHIITEAVNEHYMGTHGMEKQNWVLKVKHEIDLAARSGKMDLRDIAKRLHYTPETLKRHFTKIAGYSPGVYFRSAIMNYAAELVHDSNLSIAEISEKLGYCDQFHFSRQFKKALGKSPVQFRKTGHNLHVTGLTLPNHRGQVS